MELPWKSKANKSLRSKEYASSRKLELEGLVSYGTFLVMKRSEVPTKTRILGSNFVDELKLAEK